MTNTPFNTDEISISQLPAMVLLAKMGWKPLTVEEVNNARRNRQTSVILDDITRGYLKNQKLSWAGQEVSLNDDNIETLLVRLRNVPPATYGKQAEDKWNLLCLPQSIEQMVDGSRRSLNARFIDFENPENNQFHMAAEFIVEKLKNIETRRPDIVLFVNGIPMAVIENKKAATEVTEGVSQSIRNQKSENIPHLFVYSQIILSVNKNDNRYATTGTPAKLWNRWREHEIDDEQIQNLIDTPLTPEQRNSIFSDGFEKYEERVDKAEIGRTITDQDRTLIGLCSPERLLCLTREFIIFDGPNKIIARFQQFYAVRRTMSRLQGKGNSSERGGVIWHTQGSGKSLTMVMLANAILLHSKIKDARIVLVTDRVDLDKQIKSTFVHAGMETKRAKTGNELIDLINGNASVITTIINKFEAVARAKVKDESENIFLLVDEGHRSQSGNYNAQMERVFPNAHYIAFTGTPIAKKDKNTMKKFGSIIDKYTMRQAVDDGAVVPLIYEGRVVKPEEDAKAIDIWFDRITVGMSREQKADFKTKYARASLIPETNKVIQCRAYDIAGHYNANYKGTGLKAQLVASSRVAAIQFKKELDEIGLVTSEVLIAGPDTRKGHEEVDEEEPTDEVIAFWEKMMNKWGDEEKYNEGLISKFKYSEDPEIIIVKSKLLTGFDAPRNTVLYLASKLRGHNLLQAIARVNRVLDNGSEEFGEDIDSGKKSRIYN